MIVIIMLESDVTQLYDLHSHTTASDGMLTPQELVVRAADKGVTTLAITDHDTLAGLAPARQAIEQQSLSLTLVNGVEISTLWEHHEIHIVGLQVDESNLELNLLLEQQRKHRLARAQKIDHRLEKARIPGALAGAEQFAAGAAITRAHFARYLVKQGYATTIPEVFNRYLSRGKTGYVPPMWCSIEQAITAIHAAGGVAVVAHPGRYQLSNKWLRRLLQAFAQWNGDAMEISQCQQAVNERTMLAQYANQFGLLASQGSDFHQPCQWAELGYRLLLPPQVTPVWQHW